MLYLVVYFILSSVLFQSAWSDSAANDAVCKEYQKERVAKCFDKSTLGFCMLVTDEWRAIEVTTCDSKSCCDVKAMGCTMNCEEESTTTTTSTENPSSTSTEDPSSTSTENPSSTSTPKPAVTCVVGNLKKHESDCKKYYYCSNHVWVESVCAAGVFNERQMSCAFGTCST